MERLKGIEFSCPKAILLSSQDGSLYQETMRSLNLETTRRSHDVKNRVAGGLQLNG